mmetsp:Transcript_39162/g.93612  ORF Transcript_39162/g.93612 Transcript_39162/m.93612 type:complete len:119 (-) Transcript_39162:120-476(-)
MAASTAATAASSSVDPALAALATNSPNGSQRSKTFPIAEYFPFRMLQSSSKKTRQKTLPFLQKGLIKTASPSGPNRDLWRETGQHHISQLAHLRKLAKQPVHLGETKYQTLRWCSIGA